MEVGSDAHETLLLRARWPRWQISASYQAAGTGPGATVYTARQGELTVRAFSVASLESQLEEAEAEAGTEAAK